MTALIFLAVVGLVLWRLPRWVAAGLVRLIGE